MSVKLKALAITAALPTKGRSTTGLGRFDDDQSRAAFCEQVWPGTGQYGQQTPLIRHYGYCCNSAFVSGEAVDERPNSDIVAAVEAIKANKNRDEVLKLITGKVHAGHPDDSCSHEDQKVAEHLITIAFTTALMCNVGTGHVRANPTASGPRQLVWDVGTAKALVEDAFPKSNNLQGEGRLPRTFHARNLERLGSIQLVWTRNLFDHLRLHDPVEEGRPFTVTVFHYAQFLQSNQNSDVFPEGLISETLRTLALLFPGHVGGTIGWFKGQQKADHDLDISTCLCSFSDNENRTIQSFSFWRDRITILKQTYDESEPKSIWQWWNDGRKRERWATFWVALVLLFLTVFFGIIQCTEGALQVYKAYHPS